MRYEPPLEPQDTEEAPEDHEQTRDDFDEPDTEEPDYKELNRDI